MSRLHRAVMALTVTGCVLAGGLAFAQAKPAAKPATPAPAAQAPAAPATQAPNTPTKWVAPVRGVADVQMIGPKVSLKGNIVTTVIEVKNVSNGAIAGLQVEQYWWDKANNPVPGGDRFRNRKLLMPGEVLTITLTSEKDAKMFRDNYQFKHANGDVKVKVVKKF